MKSIIKKEMCYFFKNPIFIIGAIILSVGTIYLCMPFLDKVPPDFNNTKLDITDIGDVDIQEGYLPIEKSEEFEIGMDVLADSLLNDLDLKKSEVNRFLTEVKEKNMSVEEVSNYVREKYNYEGAEENFHGKTKVKKGTEKEINEYVETSLSKERFSEYFARKYSDLLGVGAVIFSSIVLMLLFSKEIKKDMIELLHTKPINTVKFIMGKMIGALSSILVIIALITFILDILMTIKGHNYMLSTSFIDIWKYVFWINVPVIVFLVSLSSALSIAFRST